MTDWEIVYYSDDVQETIGAWPVGVRAYYARLTERMRVFGPNLGMPFTRSMGQGLFEIRARGEEGLGRAFFCTVEERKIVVLRIRQEIAEGAAKGTRSRPQALGRRAETQGGR